MVKDWKDAWRWISINCMASAAAIQGAWAFIPDDMRDNIPRHLTESVTGGLLMLGIIGRLVKQPARKKKRK